MTRDLVNEWDWTTAQLEAAAYALGREASIAMRCALDPAASCVWSISAKGLWRQAAHYARVAVQRADERRRLRTLRVEVVG